MIPITTHTIVVNEENWIWYALMSVKDHATKMLVVDDSSSDKTNAIVKTLDIPQMNFTQAKLTKPGDFTAMRNTLIDQTQTEWFMILDGDEIWNSATLTKFLEFLEKQPKHIYAVTMRTRNCIGDIYHYLPETSGRYALLGIKGNLNIRAYRKLPGFKFIGDYPLEAYCDREGRSINNQDSHLSFFDDYYWHTTFLKRSSDRTRVKGWRSKKTELGIKVKSKNEYPEVFNLPAPSLVSSPWEKMKTSEYLVSAALTPLKLIKRKIIK